MLPLLQGTLEPQVDTAKYERAVEALKESGLNDSQVEAVAMSYAADLLHLIQGPPGTGQDPDAGAPGKAAGGRMGGGSS